MSKKKINLPKLSAEQKKELLRASLSLFVVCAVSALLLAGVNRLVSGFVDNEISPVLASAMERVFPAEGYEPFDFEFEEANSVVAVYEAKEEKETLGYCVVTTAPDYDGEMSALVAVDMEGKVMAVEIISMPEGVGTKVKDVAFLSRFTSKSGKLYAVKSEAKDDSQISVISGATTSSNAVVECVNHAVSAVSQILAEQAKEAVGE